MDTNGLRKAHARSLEPVIYETVTVLPEMGSGVLAYDHIGEGRGDKTLAERIQSSQLSDEI